MWYIKPLNLLSVCGSQDWSSLLFCNDHSSATSLYSFVIAFSGVISNILILSLAINLKHAVVHLRFFRCKGKSHFTDIVMVIVVVQIFLCAMVNTIMASPIQKCCGYLDALAMTCLLTILSVTATFTSHVHCFCCHSIV